MLQLARRQEGDRVAIYLPLIPELAIAMLACARIGAVHCVVFGGFSAESLRDRINDPQAQACSSPPTAATGAGNVVPLKRVADEARGRHAVDRARGRRAARGTSPFDEELKEGRDHWYHELMRKATPRRASRRRWTPRTCSTSSTPRARPGSRRASSTRRAAISPASYATTKWVFDLKEDDVYWCTADIGWVTGHSYVVYGPLANGATVVMYEGAPDCPHKDRFWDIVARYGVTIFYTAPTAIRAFMRWGPEWPEKHDLSTLRLLGSVGEPINPEAWMWYHQLHRQGALPDRGHVVADGNRPDHDHAAARHHDDEARLGDAAVPGHQGRDPATTTVTPWMSAAGSSR